MGKEMAESGEEELSLKKKKNGTITQEKYR